MNNIRFRLRSSNLEAHQGTQEERRFLEFAEVDEDNRFINNGATISIRASSPGEYSQSAVYSFGLIAE